MLTYLNRRLVQAGLVAAVSVTMASTAMALPARRTTGGTAPTPIIVVVITPTTPVTLSDPSITCTNNGHLSGTVC